ncbi:hypothetical protein EZS27_010818 [termite gut metagenome]|uniref:Uncharacterized protein n=1 Tax=termite gut metagenome TaxID=433724 RepID=A0A5J4S6D4_9ZZZZ
MLDSSKRFVVVKVQTSPHRYLEKFAIIGALAAYSFFPKTIHLDLFL